MCSHLCELAEYNPPLPVALALTSFLSQCGGLQIPTHLQVGWYYYVTCKNGRQPCMMNSHVLFFQSEVLQCLVGMFRCLLGHKDWLVHHHALEAFRSFAEVRTCRVGERGPGKRGYLPRASRYNWGLAVIELGDHTCSVASSHIIGLSQRRPSSPPAHMYAS